MMLARTRERAEYSFVERFVAGMGVIGGAGLSALWGPWYALATGGVVIVLAVVLAVVDTWRLER